MTDILFGVLSTTAASLLALNATIVTLKLMHRNDMARHIGSVVAPYVAYLRLDGKGGSDRSKHA